MDRKIRIAAVSYLNTRPLVYGFEKGMMDDQVELSFNYPSKVAELLQSGNADVGLVPVAVIPQLSESYIISGYCIGTESEVASVCLFSQVPLKEIKTIYLDYQSRTSVALLRILLKHHWKISPDLVHASEGYESLIGANAAGLIIGDRALRHRKNASYIYDLGTAWVEMTRLPFVFAVWLANKQLPESFKTSFNTATGEGLNHLEEIAASEYLAEYDLKFYYTQNISYTLDEAKMKGMQRFLEYLSF